MKKKFFSEKDVWWTIRTYIFFNSGVPYGMHLIKQGCMFQKKKNIDTE